jgi:Tfp pilus assembly protein PilO
MTPLEQWLLDNLFQILVIVGGGIWAFVKLNGRANSLEKTVADHLQAELPHPICRTESANLESIKASLAEVKEKLDTLDNRIVDLIRNGSYYRSPAAPKIQPKQ